MRDYILKSVTFWMCVVGAIIGLILSPTNMGGFGIVLGAVVAMIIRIFLPICRAMFNVIVGLFD